MKTKHYLHLSILTLIALTACNKNNDTVYTSYEPRRVVTKYLIRITQLKNTGNEITEFLYDDQKRLATIRTGTRLTVNYTYNTNTVATTDVVAIEGGTKTRNLYQYTYAADILKSTNQKTYVNDVLTKESNYTHEITRGIVMRSVMEPGAVTTQYTFADGNVSTFSGNGTTLTYTYDGQKSIYLNSLTAVPLPGDPVDRFSKSNVVKMVFANGSAINYTYTYDVDGYPIALLTGAERYTFAYATL